MSGDIPSIPIPNLPVPRPGNPKKIGLWGKLRKKFGLDKLPENICPNCGGTMQLTWAMADLVHDVALVNYKGKDLPIVGSTKTRQVTRRYYRCGTCSFMVPE